MGRGKPLKILSLDCSPGAVASALLPLGPLLLPPCPALFVATMCPVCARATGDVQRCHVGCLTAAYQRGDTVARHGSACGLCGAFGGSWVACARLLCASS